MDELYEIALEMYNTAPAFDDFGVLQRWVEDQMPGESQTVKERVAYYLWEMQHEVDK